MANLFHTVITPHLRTPLGATPDILTKLSVANPSITVLAVGSGLSEPKTGSLLIVLHPNISTLSILTSPLGTECQLAVSNMPSFLSITLLATIYALALSLFTTMISLPDSWHFEQRPAAWHVSSSVTTTRNFLSATLALSSNLRDL